MSISYGFYNSVEGDRKYDATVFSQIFDGIINDGVFMSIGTSMMVKATTGMIVNVGIGRAWLNSTWTYNDSILSITLDDSDYLMDRIDAVVIEVNRNDNVRKNDIKIVKGTESLEPVRPTLQKDENVFQYPLAYIYVKKTATAITQANITNMVGTSELPFVTGVLKTMDVEPLVAQWKQEWYEWVEATQAENSNWTTEQRQTYLNWVAQQETDLENWCEGFKTAAEAFENVSEDDFVTWFNSIKGQLTTDAAGNLQNQINTISEDEFRRWYSMYNKTTEVFKNGSGKTTSIVETDSNGVATTTFDIVDGSKVIRTVMVPNEGNWNYYKTATITKLNNSTKIVQTYNKVIK